MQPTRKYGKSRPLADICIKKHPKYPFSCSERLGGLPYLGITKTYFRNISRLSLEVAMPGQMFSLRHKWAALNCLRERLPAEYEILPQPRPLPQSPR
jgi:hypothetical protein